MKKILAIILSMAMLFALCACGSTGSETAASSEADAGKTESGEKTGLIGFCSVSMSESIYVLEQEALENIFAGKAEVQTVSCDQDAATQIQQIKTFVTMGADLLVINPTDIDAISDAIIEAHNAGIKVYINGATSENLSDEYYDCCTVSDEYVSGAYVALIAKNWIEAHADMLTAANPDWEIAFLESSLGEETLKRSYGEQSLVDPWLKDWEGNYVDANGNIVDEANKVANDAYCEIAAAHYKGVVVEQDQTNGGLNVANILTASPNVRVFIAYNSLASTQGGQYIVDNYADQLDEFAFFSSGVMGNEADYIVGSVSKTDGVTPSVMRGATQFGVSAAGGEVADTVANTAYAIMYGTEGVDYNKKMADGIAAWWAVDEEWGSGTASVAHFNITSGGAVKAFDPIAALSDSSTVFYWNSKDGFVESATAEEDGAEETAAIVGESFTYSENNGFMDINWTLTLAEDGTYGLTEQNQIFPDGNTYTGSYTREGDTVVCGKMDGSGPDVFDWANPEGFTVTVGAGTFAPDGVELAAGPGNIYTYEEVNAFGLTISWTLELKDDGTYVLSESNDFVGELSYEGTEYKLEGDALTCGAMVSGPDIFDWANPEGFTATLGEGVFTPDMPAA